jgi:hypothetical protein
VVGYSKIESIDQMKNALYFRASHELKASNGLYSDISEILWPSDNKDLHEEAHLGRGFSAPSGGTVKVNHAVVVVGWGPCTVKPCNSDSDEEIEAECWIGKYYVVSSCR